MTNRVKLGFARGGSRAADRITSLVRQIVNLDQTRAGGAFARNDCGIKPKGNVGEDGGLGIVTDPLKLPFT